MDGVVVESGGAGSGDPLAECGFEFGVGVEVAGGEGGGDEGAASGFGGDESLAFEFAVGLEDGVGVDGDLGDDLLDRGQLVPHGEHAESQGLLHLVDELHVRGHAGARFEVEVDHNFLYFTRMLAL